NMCPEYGATIGFFPVDSRTIDYLTQTGRDTDYTQRVEQYLKSVGMFVNFTDDSYRPTYTTTLKLDLGSVVPSVSGPKRPHDRVELASLAQDFSKGLTDKISFKA
ncbi:aconitate hydratase, partial [Escherichia coli]|nr:aconitate hydratase [Escherichia coli]